MGSSIGADGAADGCAWLNEQEPGYCQEALSLSPGDFLVVPYEEAVQKRGQSQPPVAAWCLVDENEVAFCNKASEAGNTKFKAVEIPNGQHGNMMLRLGLTPDAMQTILGFLAQTVGP